MPQLLYRAKNRLLGRIGSNRQDRGNLLGRTVLHVAQDKRCTFDSRQTLHGNRVLGVDLATQQQPVRPGTRVSQLNSSIFRISFLRPRDSLYRVFACLPGRARN